ncbi:hypothetical protein [Mesorhizobium sp.]|uniref:hypothetical protein n=1 Tax=Mesorhizobium sp. TaxID=1871066 RepID=UPI000FE5FA15|nr:hypothetical protein [Mesorhizobium sp.]RWI22050.1 MAG: hypothetical protein EOQ92_18820 [Mesorhizobium sp.]RWK46097.1 MAG: hypothetical protein EOR47_27720 [Mesorhizobium sp.]RWK92336.1 MAG: hypothetical protein EOR53_26850 [Mesorhizobium sp.]TIP57763.1 MAG: hypothetical protein E5X56_18365 [Mesorhizobium sp.]TIP79863.1 MAG: hypothetical protein E5X58_41395 [Mesorhizobium sp.]
MRDLANNIGAILALSPAVQAATIKGVAVDLLGFESAALIINTGAIVGAGDYTPKLQESDTTVDADFADVAASKLVGALPASLTADGAFKQGYIGFKRYIRVVVTKNAGTSIAAGAVIVKANARSRPVA